MSKLTENEALDLWKSLKAPPSWVQFILALFTTFIAGFTIKVLWGWYIVPLGVSAITLVHAIGSDALITFVVTTTAPQPSTGLYWYRFTHAVLITISTLLIGWAFHFFM